MSAKGKKGKPVAVVTGADAGIGNALVKLLIDEVQWLMACKKSTF